MRRVVLCVLMLLANEASASFFGFVDPPGGLKDFGPVNVGSTSAPVRIIIQEVHGADEQPASLSEPAHVSPPFQIVASGTLPDGKVFFDTVVTPTEANLDDCSSFFDIHWYDPSADDFRFGSITVFCDARRTPFDAADPRFQLVPPGSIETRTVTVQNTTPQPTQIDGLIATDALFRVRLRTGTLPVTIPPEGTFDVDVTFSSATPNTQYSAEVRVQSGGAEHFAFRATVRTLGFVELAPLPRWDMVPVGDTYRYPSELVSYASTPVTISSVSSSNPSFGLADIAPGTVIPPFGRIPVAATYAPVITGPDSTWLTVTFDNVAEMQKYIGLSGIAEQFVLTTNDGATNDGILDFGVRPLGATPLKKRISLKNTGPSAGLDCTKTGSFDFVATECATTLPTGVTRVVDVTFTSTTPGPARGAIQFHVFAGGQHRIVSVLFTASVPSSIAPASEPTFADTVRHPDTPTFGELVITNSGTQSVPAPAATLFGDADVFALVASASGDVPPGGTAVYRVAFTPPAAGDFSGALVLSNGEIFELFGRGVLRPVTSPDHVDFGPIVIGEQQRANVILTNSGVDPVAISSIVSSDPRFTILTPTGAIIAASGTAALEIEYTPSAIGEELATLSVSLDNDPEPQLTITLRGEGVVDPPDPPDYDPPSPPSVDPAVPGDDISAPPDGDAPPTDEPSHDGGCSSSGGSGGSGGLALLAIALLLSRRVSARRSGVSERRVSHRAPCAAR